MFTLFSTHESLPPTDFHRDSDADTEESRNIVSSVSTNPGEGDDGDADEERRISEEKQFDRRQLDVGEWVGKGASGVIRRARWNRSEGGCEDVVVKKIFFRSKQELEKCEKEYRMMCKLSHSNILECRGFYRDPLVDDVFHIVLEYCPGGPVLSWLHRKHHPARLSEVVDADFGGLEADLEMSHLLLRLDQIRKLVAGMCYLHKMGVIHLDLKPENILVSVDGELKIIDFGFSRNEESMTNTSICGSPGYFLFGDYGHPPTDPKKRDVFSFAIVAWEIWTGFRAFSRLRSWNAIAKSTTIHTKNLRPDLDLCLGMSGGMKKLLQRCWSREGANRPSFEEIAVELRERDEEIREEIQRMLELRKEALCFRRSTDLLRKVREERDSLIVPSEVSTKSRLLLLSEERKTQLSELRDLFLIRHAKKWLGWRMWIIEAKRECEDCLSSRFEMNPLLRKSVRQQYLRGFLDDKQRMKRNTSLKKERLASLLRVEGYTNLHERFDFVREKTRIDLRREELFSRRAGERMSAFEETVLCYRRRFERQIFLALRELKNASEEFRRSFRTFHETGLQIEDLFEIREAVIEKCDVLHHCLSSSFIIHEDPLIPEARKTLVVVRDGILRSDYIVLQEGRLPVRLLGDEGGGLRCRIVLKEHLLRNCYGSTSRVDFDGPMFRGKRNGVAPKVDGQTAEAVFVDDKPSSWGERLDLLHSVCRFQCDEILETNEQQVCGFRNPPLLKLVAEGTVKNSNHEVLTWCVGNRLEEILECVVLKKMTPLAFGGIIVPYFKRYLREMGLLLRCLLVHSVNYSDYEEYWEEIRRFFVMNSLEFENENCEDRLFSMMQQCIVRRLRNQVTKEAEELLQAEARCQEAKKARKKEARRREKIIEDQRRQAKEEAERKKAAIAARRKADQEAAAQKRRIEERRMMAEQRKAEKAAQRRKAQMERVAAEDRRKAELAQRRIEEEKASAAAAWRRKRFWLVLACVVIIVIIVLIAIASG